MMPLLRLIAVAILASSPALLVGFGAAAEPLDKEACAKLELERKKLLTRDMQAALERGPDWVKDHLNSEEIEEVRAFLAVEEMIVFRCRGGGVAKPKPPEQAATGAGVPLPDRNPNRPPTVTADTSPGQGAAEGDAPAPTDAAETGPDQPVADSDKPAPSQAPETGPSQTVADSDKTAPSKTKTTR